VSSHAEQLGWVGKWGIFLWSFAICVRRRHLIKYFVFIGKVIKITNSRWQSSLKFTEDAGFVYLYDAPMAALQLGFAKNNYPAFVLFRLL